MWLVRSSFGFLGAFIYYALVIYVTSVTVALGIKSLTSGPSEVLLLLTYLTLVVLSVVCHLRVMLTDPGSLPQRSVTEEQASMSRVCSVCLCIKTRRAHHCSTCGRCIMRMDHHCPWVNNCVGALNQKHFLLFLTYTALAALCSLGILAARLGEALSGKGWDTANPGDRIQVFLGISAFALSLMNTCFLALMLVDQLGKVLRGTTGIERLQQALVPYVSCTQRPSKERLYEVCGGKCSLSWLCPFSVSAPTPELSEHELL